MRVPDALMRLCDDGVVDAVVRPIQSGKEAVVYEVLWRGSAAVAKVYKDAQIRSFQHRADYTEGRKVRRSRDQRAIDKGSRFGRERAEHAWRSTEVGVIYKLAAAGVRVPQPYDFVDGVLIMELVSDASGRAAPRFVDVELTEREASWLFNTLLSDVMHMLCAGVIHGDLSDFNVLLAHDGPVVIDFPQAVDPAANQSARRLLVRDVDNLTRFFARYLPELRDRRFGPEMWDLYERNELRPDSILTGRWRPKRTQTNVSALLREMENIEREVRERQAARAQGSQRQKR